MLRISEDDPNMKMIGYDFGGGEIYAYQGAPFTGILINNYPDGNLLEEITCVNGYPEGLQRSYYENGQVEQECYYKYNRLYSTFTQWDENGNITSQNDAGPEPMGF